MHICHQQFLICCNLIRFYNFCLRNLNKFVQTLEFDNDMDQLTDSLHSQSTMNHHQYFCKYKSMREPSSTSLRVFDPLSVSKNTGKL